MKKPNTSYTCSKNESKLAPSRLFTPFTKMAKNSFIAQFYACKQTTNQQQMPLNAGFKLIQNTVDNLNKATLCLKTAVCGGQMRQYLIFYYTFAQYLVHKGNVLISCLAITKLTFPTYFNKSKVVKTTSPKK